MRFSDGALIWILDLCFALRGFMISSLGWRMGFVTSRGLDTGHMTIYLGHCIPDEFLPTRADVIWD